MITPDVGQEIDSHCGKCKEPTLHIILAKVGEDIAKVQCKRCQAQHRYRPVGAAKKKKATRKKASKKGKSKSTRSRRTRADDLKPRVKPNMSLPVRPYSLRESYTPGERIEHKKFGVGVVEALSSQKMEVFFQGNAENGELVGRRTLAQGR